jgi:GNAT superfamily N-acetyltransferase
VEPSPSGGYWVRVAGHDAPLQRCDTEEEAEDACRRYALAAVRDALAPPPRGQVVALPGGIEVLVCAQLERREGAELTATDRATGAEVGAGRYRRLDGRPGCAEAAVAVAVAWRGRGVGGALLRRLAAHAATQGVTHFVGPEGELALADAAALEAALRAAARGYSSA